MMSPYTQHQIAGNREQGTVNREQGTLETSPFTVHRSLITEVAERNNK